MHISNQGYCVSILKQIANDLRIIENVPSFFDQKTLLNRENALLLPDGNFEPIDLPA